jgi:nitrous oxidase accessory protein
METKYLRAGLILVACLLAYLAISVILAAVPLAGAPPSPVPGPGGNGGQNLTPKKITEVPLALGQWKNQTVILGNSVNITLNRTDLKGRILAYEAGVLPPGARFFSGNRTLLWTPDLSQSGNFAISFTARNGSLATGQRLYITVKEAELPDVINMTLKNFLDLAARPAPLSRGYPGGFGAEHARVVHPGESIQAAVEQAGRGDLILVEGGTYPERVVINTPLSLWGLENPVIDGEGKGSPVSINVDGVTVDGFSLRNSGSSLYASGIKIASNRNLIANNTITGNQYGIFVIPPTDGNLIQGNRILNSSFSGIYIPNSRNGNIRSNTLVNNRIGIEIETSWYMAIMENTVSFNNGDGINLTFSQNNQIGKNIVMNNKGVGLFLSSGGKNRITGNFIGKNGGNGIETRDFSDITLLGNQILGSLDSLFLNFIENNTVKNQKGHGVFSYYTNDLIRGNEIGSNRYGIYLVGSQSLATDNLLSGNSFGIYLLNSGNSTLSGNDVQGNTNGIRVDGRSPSNEFTANEITDNRADGFTLTKSTERNIIRDNIIANNTGPGLSNLGNNQVMSNILINNTRI